MDITNLKTESAKSQQFIEYFKQKTIISANNTFQAVVNAALEHPELKQIVLMKQIPRYDSGIKQMLSKLFNDTLDQLYDSYPKKNKIILGNHSLDCSGGIFEARYRNSQTRKFDGIHLYGPSGIKAYTTSVLSILNSAQLVRTQPPKYYDQFEHMKCPQARYQARQSRSQGRQYNKVQAVKVVKNITSNYEYSVPTYNRFARLDDQSYQGNY